MEMMDVQFSSKKIQWHCFSSIAADSIKKKVANSLCYLCISIESLGKCHT